MDRPPLCYTTHSSPPSSSSHQQRSEGGFDAPYSLPAASTRAMELLSAPQGLPTQSVLLCVQLYDFALYGVDTERFPPPYSLQGVVHHQRFSTLWEQESSPDGNTTTTTSTTHLHKEEEDGEDVENVEKGDSAPWSSRSSAVHNDLPSVPCNARWRTADTLVTSMATLQIPRDLLSPMSLVKGTDAGEAEERLEAGNKTPRSGSRSRSTAREVPLQHVVRWWRKCSEQDIAAALTQTSAPRQARHRHCGMDRGADVGLAVQVYSYGTRDSPSSTYVGAATICLGTLLQCPPGSRVRLTLTRRSQGIDAAETLDEDSDRVMRRSPGEEVSCIVGELFGTVRAELRAQLAMSVQHVHVSPNPLSVWWQCSAGQRNHNSSGGRAPHGVCFPPSTIALDMRQADLDLLEVSPSQSRASSPPAAASVCFPSLPASAGYWTSGTGVDERTAYPRWYPNVLTAHRVVWSYASPNSGVAPLSAAGGRGREAASADRVTSPRDWDSRSATPLGEWLYPFSIVRGGFRVGTPLAHGILYQEVVPLPGRSAVPHTFRDNGTPLTPLGTYQLTWPPVQYRLLGSPATTEGAEAPPPLPAEVLVDAIFVTNVIPRPPHTAAQSLRPNSSGSSSMKPIRLTAQARLRIPVTEPWEVEAVQPLLQEAVRQAAMPFSDESAAENGGSLDTTTKSSTAPSSLNSDADGGEGLERRNPRRTKPLPSRYPVQDGADGAPPGAMSALYTPKKTGSETCAASLTEQRESSAGGERSPDVAEPSNSHAREEAKAGIPRDSPSPSLTHQPPHPHGDGERLLTGEHPFLRRGASPPAQNVLDLPREAAHDGRLLSLTPSPTRPFGEWKDCEKQDFGGSSQGRTSSVFHLTALEQQEMERTDHLFMQRLQVVRQAKVAIQMELAELRGESTESPWSGELASVRDARATLVSLSESIQQLQREMKESETQLEATKAILLELHDQAQILNREVHSEEEHYRTMQHETKKLKRKVEDTQQELLHFMDSELQRYAGRLQSA